MSPVTVITLAAQGGTPDCIIGRKIRGPGACCKMESSRQDREAIPIKISKSAHPNKTCMARLGDEGRGTLTGWALPLDEESLTIRLPRRGKSVFPRDKLHPMG